MRRKAADEVQMMTTTTSLGDVEPYIEQLRKAAIDTLVAGGMTIAAATDWVIQAEREPTSAEAMSHYRQRWVTGIDEPAPIDWVSDEVLDELEAQLHEQREASAPWRRFLLGGEHA